MQCILNKYLSIGYIHRYWTGPASFISWTRWIVRWTITMKKDGGKTISKWQSVRMILFCNWSSSSTIKTLEHNFRKKEYSSTKMMDISGGNVFLIASGSNCCIRICESWLFSPITFLACKSMHCEMLLEYRSGTFIFFNVTRKISLCCFVRVNFAN